MAGAEATTPGRFGLAAKLFVVLILLGLTELNDDAWKQLREASPSTYVHAGQPPFLLIHGDKDQQVPYAQSIRFQEQMKAAGNANASNTKNKG